MAEIPGACNLGWVKNGRVNMAAANGSRHIDDAKSATSRQQLSLPTAGIDHTDRTIGGTELTVQRTVSAGNREGSPGPRPTTSPAANSRAKRRAWSCISILLAAGMNHGLVM